MEEYTVKHFVEEDDIPPQPIKVYIKINDNNDIINVGSDIFIKDIANWTKIDEGFGDRYAHAQSQYFAKSLINDSGNYRYKYLNGNIAEII